MTLTDKPALSVVPPAVPPFRKEGLGWVYEPTQPSVRLRAEFLKRKGDELSGYIVVENLDPTDPPHVHEARLTYSSTTARASLSRHLAELAPGIDAHTWGRLLEQFCSAVLRREREGSPLLLLGTQAQEARRPDLVERLIQHGQITNLFGPFGAGKGQIAVALCVCHVLGISFCGLRVTKGTPLYIDYEADQATFIERVQAVCRGLGVPPVAIPWVKPRDSFLNSVHSIARHMTEVGADLGVLDSVTRATGVPSEHASYASMAQEIVSAIDVLGPEVAWLLLDHVSGEGLNAKLAGKAMGSIQKMGDARVGWEIRKDQDAETDSYHLGLYHTKFNNTRRFAPIGIRLDFDNDEDDRARAVTFERQDVRESTELGSRLDAATQIRHALGRGIDTIPAICDATGLETNTVRVALIRGQGKWSVDLNPNTAGGRGAVKRWGLLNPKTLTPPHTPPSVRV